LGRRFRAGLVVIGIGYLHGWSFRRRLPHDHILSRQVVASMVGQPENGVFNRYLVLHEAFD